MRQELPVSQHLSRNSELRYPLELKYPLRVGEMSSPISCNYFFFFFLTCESHIASLLGDVSAPLTPPDLSQNVLPPSTGEQGASVPLLTSATAAFPHKLSLSPSVAETRACFGAGPRAHPEL